MSASVIIVSHRPHQWLHESVASVVGQADEVLVVDNGSGGAVGSIAREAGARVVELPTNVGFPGGVNAGVIASRGRFLALLNDDAMAEPGWVSASITALGAPGVGAVTPKLVFKLPFAELRFADEPHHAPGDHRPLGRALRSIELRGNDLLAAAIGPGLHALEEGELDGSTGRWRWTTGPEPIFVPLPDEAAASELTVDGDAAPVERVVDIINSAGTYLSSHGFGGDYGYGSPDDGTFDIVGERFGGCGAALVTTRETWLRLGGMAAEYFAYYEDLDWSWRLRLAGLSTLYDPAGVVRHVGGATSGGPVSEHVRGLAERNRLLTLARNAPLPVVRSEVRRSAPARATSVAIARALRQRARLRRTRTVPVRSVWSTWAGRDERWPHSGPG